MRINRKIINIGKRGAILLASSLLAGKALDLLEVWNPLHQLTSWKNHDSQFESVSTLQFWITVSLGTR